MNQSDINNYNNILSNQKINYSDKLWLGITNNVCEAHNHNSNNNLNIIEKLEKELNERKYNTFVKE
jgi:hypothetical protein